MKSLQRYALLLIVFIGSATFCFAQSGSPPPPPPPVIEYNAAAWKEYSSAEGGFSIKMPGTPQTATMLTDTDAAPEKISFRTHFLQTQTGYYAVMYSDLPVYSDEAATIKLGLEEFRNVMLRDKDMKLLREKEITFNDKPALDLLLENSFTVVQARVFLVKERLYILMFATRPNVAFKSGRSSVQVEDQTDLYQAITTRFLGSFKVIPRQTATNARNIGTGSGIGSGIGTGVGSGSAAPKPEGEVDSLLKQLEEKNQVVLGRCLDNSPCTSFKAEGVHGSLTADELLEGKMISLPQPPYPPIAKAARAYGTIVVKVVLDESGKVIAAQVLSGHPLLQAAALKAAREARFEPTTLGGKPIKVTGNISYNFVLQ